ncbi:MAG: hypothetical protein IKX35_09565 [Bacteroidales bacterium]|nr:hypothetical protein [Bacteroidales bacterium]
MNKKSILLVALLAMMSFSVKAQWFDFSQNTTRGVVGFHTGLVGYNNVNDIPDMSLSDLGVGLSLNLAGVYADFLYVTPDHMYDSHVVFENWDDHDAFVINVGYQIPIYQDYVFITPLIGWSRVSTGITEGNNIGVDTEAGSIFHKYHSTWHRNDFNYGGMLTVVPCKYFEINAAFTAHAAYAGIAFNLANFE